MRYALLVAAREYAENAKTKGFWIGIFIFPIMIWAGMTVPGLLEEATPTRYFVLVDQSGQFDRIAEEGIERLYQRDVMKAFGEYVGSNARRPEGPIDLEQVPAMDPDEMVERFADDNPELLDAFLAQGGLEAALEQMRPMLREDAPEFELPRRRFQRVTLPDELAADAPLDSLAQELKPYLRGDRSVEAAGERRELFAAVLIPPDVESTIVRPGGLPRLEGEPAGIQYWAVNLADDDLRDEIEYVVNKEIRRREYVERGVDAETVQRIQRTHVPVASLNPKKEAGEEAVSMADRIRQWAPVAFVYLLWIGIFTILQMLLNNTIEEKSNRIIEVLLSSVTPGELMLGKLIGIASVGLTMLVCWIAALIAVLLLKSGQEVEFARQSLQVLKDSGLVPAFAAYFLLGYLMYAGIFLAIGSVCNTLKEAQNLMGPVMMVMIVPLLTMFFIPKDPNGTLATVLSWIPLYTPFVMMNRAAADPPLFDVVGTSIVLVGTTVLVLWASGKVFRIGILRTGQPPRLRELVRWVRG